jgi:sugar-phosphatase
MCRQTMGYRADEVVSYWFGRYPWSGKTLETVEREILETLMRLIATRGTAMPGVHGVLEQLAQQGLQIALASSSPCELINAVLDKLRIAHYFEVKRSAMDEDFGKPNPAVYLSTVAELGALPSECIALEDSVNGVRAAKAAGIVTIAVPDSDYFEDTRFEEADFKLRSLQDFGMELIRNLVPRKTGQSWEPAA